VILWDDPIYVSKDETAEGLEAIRAGLEKKLTELTERADDMACQE
jgi:hypothetical protein